MRGPDNDVPGGALSLSRVQSVNKVGGRQPAH